jgi:pimeloyl-ACP methyl ester carboxylesterase
MKKFIPWNSQELDAWAQKHAEGSFVDLAGHRTHFIEVGSGDPVILVHGFFFDAFTWHNNLDALSASFRVIAPDLWGFGYSTREPLDYGYALYTRQLLSLMDALEIEKASIVGHSMGGGAAIHFATHHPDRVDRLLLVDTTGMANPLPVLGRLGNLPVVGELMYGMQSDFFRRMALKTTWFHDKQHVTDDYLERATRFHKIRGSTETMLSILRKQFFHTLAEEVRALNALNIPTLIVWGKSDMAIPMARGAEMHAELSNSRFVVFDDIGHCPHDESADRFNLLALEFLGV